MKFTSATREGLIAVWLDEQDAHDMAAHYGHRDAFSGELIAGHRQGVPGRSPGYSGRRGYQQRGCG